MGRLWWPPQNVYILWWPPNNNREKYETILVERSTSKIKLVERGWR